jgi:hypothetical protein
VRTIVIAEIVIDHIVDFDESQIDASISTEWVGTSLIIPGHSDHPEIAEISVKEMFRT